MKAIRMDFIAGLLMTALVGCNPGEAARRKPPIDERLYQAGSSEEIHNAFRTLHYLPPHMLYNKGLPQTMGEAYSPRTLLPQLHQVLAEGAGLERVLVEGYEMLRLAPLSDKTISELEKALTILPSKPGYAIFQAEFWRDLARLQRREGLTFAFLTKAPQPVSGVYFHSYSLIAFEIFANPGTLAHELRHREQHLGMTKNLDDRPPVLTRECLSDASTFFGELDATTAQMQYWLGHLEALEVIPAATTQIKRSVRDKREPQFTVNSLLGTLSKNLEYPLSAAIEFNAQGRCGDILREAITAIARQVGKEKAYIMGQSNTVLLHARTAGQRLMLEIADECAIESPECAEKIRVLDRLRKEADSEKAGIERRLEEVTRTRRESISAALRSLPENVARDLERYATGFHFFETTRPKELYEPR